ncbi:hypothetical protein SFHH103_02717 [Sinorhizobium fredii HH103]|uniref:Uncharacterized protein n=2 Tax=Rhizobium fredii TaxID=380 RepID=G9ABC1_SINF1|nr:hypothetical protein SFHH103_02717 [Sinorhizobium fredii HH103]
MQLTSGWLERLAEALDVSELELWGGFTLKDIYANGLVFSGGRVEPVAPEDHHYSTYLSPLGDMSSKWLHVEDDSFLPFFGAGDLLQFSIIPVDDIEKGDVLNGRLCMYALDGSDEVNIGTMERRHEDGTIDLRSLNGRQMKNAVVRVIWYLSGYQPNWGVVSHIPEDIAD